MTEAEPTEAEPTYRVGGPDLTWRETGAETVLLDLRGSVYFGLNPAAAMLWRRLSAGATEAELVTALAAYGGIGVERAAADVRRYLDGLRDERLLQQS
jgi:Coenzyme PQQ synthesis protein D (PqqD)